MQLLYVGAHNNLLCRMPVSHCNSAEWWAKQELTMSSSARSKQPFIEKKKKSSAIILTGDILLSFSSWLSLSLSLSQPPLPPHPFSVWQCKRITGLLRRNLLWSQTFNDLRRSLSISDVYHRWVIRGVEPGAGKTKRRFINAPSNRSGKTCNTI